MAENSKSGLLEMCGLHPLVAMGVIAIDCMLFTETAATFGAGWVLSLPVGIVLAIAVTFIQRKAFDESWMMAAGKGIMLGVLTAIPTPLPSVITFSSGTLGALGLLFNRGKNNESRE